MAFIMNVPVVGAGIFGVTAALELDAGGHRVRPVASGPRPQPLAAPPRRSGIIIDEGRELARLVERGSRVAGAITRDGAELAADYVVVAAGSWTPHLLPFTAGWFRSSAMPVFHLRPDDPALFAAD